MECSHEVVALLPERGAAVDHVDKFGDTARVPFVRARNRSARRGKGSEWNFSTTLQFLTFIANVLANPFQVSPCQVGASPKSSTHELHFELSLDSFFR